MKALIIENLCGEDTGIDTSITEFPSRVWGEVRAQGDTKLSQKSQRKACIFEEALFFQESSGWKILPKGNSSRMRFLSVGPKSHTAPPSTKACREIEVNLHFLSDHLENCFGVLGVIPIRWRNRHMANSGTLEQNHWPQATIFRLFSMIDYYKFPLLYSKSLLFIHFIHSTVYLLTPNS